MSRLASACCLAALLAVGCGGGDGSSDDAPEATPSGGSASGGAASSPAASVSDAEASHGCGIADAPTGALGRSLVSTGEERYYTVFVPDTYDAEAPLALVFVWHGLGSAGGQIRAYAGLEAEADGTAIFVYPEGTTQTTAVGTGSSWADKDLVFFDQMREAVTAEYCIDENRIFSVGHSAGGWLSNALGCMRGDVLAGVAPVAGGLVTSIGCVGNVAAVVVHGVDDPIVDYNFGLGAQDFWAGRNGCTTTATPVDPAPCVDRDACNDDLPVRWCSHTDPSLGGHGWPPWTAQAIWSVFEDVR